MEDNDAAPPRYTTRRRNAPLLQPLPDEVAQRKWNKKPAESSTVEPGTLFEVTEPPTMSEAVTKAIDEATSGVITEPKKPKKLTKKEKKALKKQKRLEKKAAKEAEAAAKNRAEIEEIIKDGVAKANELRGSVDLDDYSPRSDDEDDSQGFEEDPKVVATSAVIKDTDDFVPSAESEEDVEEEGEEEEDEGEPKDSVDLTGEDPVVPAGAIVQKIVGKIIRPAATSDDETADDDKSAEIEEKWMKKKAVAEKIDREYNDALARHHNKFDVANRIDIEALNSKKNKQRKALPSLIADWLQSPEIKNYTHSTRDLLMKEFHLVHLMNQFLGFVENEHSSRNSIACVYQDDKNNYCVKTCSLMDLQKLLDADTLKIFGVDHDLLSIYLQFAKADEGDLAVVGSDKSGAPKLPQLKQKVVNLADVWFNSPIRRSYKSICFDPRPVTHPQAPSPDKLNLWPNFRLNRQKVAKYQNFQALHLVLLHLRWVVCGSEEEFKYFLAEQAMLLQEPWHKPETCIAIGGEEGHGKTSYYENLMKPILGNLLYILLQNQEDVTGQFNSILENKLLVVCDEIFFHGDPKAANMMKNLITAAETRVSAKYKDARYTDSYAHFVLISNFVKGFINVGEKGRRYVVLEASLDHFLEALGALHNRKYDKSSYFGSLWSSFDSETLACTWANFLYNLPVGNFNPRKIPNSRLLLQQKIASMAPMVKWMMDWLYNNQIMAFNHENKTTSCAYRLHDPKPDDDKPQPNKQEMFTDVDVKVLYNSYKYHIQSSESNKKGQYSKLTPTEFEKHFVEKLPAHCRHIKHVTFTVADDKGGIRTHESKTVRLPELQTLRKHFSDCVVYGADLLWKSDLLKEDDKSDEKQPDNRLPHKLIWNMKTGVPEIKWDAKAILEDFMPLDFFGFPLAAAWKNNTWHIDPDREPVWNRNEFLQECDSQDSEEYQGKTMMQLLLSGEIYEPPKEPPKKNKRQFGDIDEPDVAGPVKKKTKPNLVE